MVNKINYIHSSVFFIFSIFISAFDYFRSNNFVYFCFFLILVLGISHGSLDYIKGKKLLKIYKIENVSFFYLSYILIGLGIIFIWVLFPYFLLLLFLIVASYHFGKEDSDFLSIKNYKNNFILKTLKGSVIIIAPLFFKQEETVEIFNSLNFYLANTFFLKQEFLLFILFLSFLSNLFLCKNESFNNKLILFSDFFSIMVLNVFLNPFLSFTLYFCFLHSFRHSTKLIFELSKKSNKGFIIFVKKAIPLTSITAILYLVVLFFLQNSFSLNESVNKVIFIGLASLTFPHILLEYLIEKNGK